MAAQQPSLTAPSPRARWLVFALAVALGAGIAAGVEATRSHAPAPSAATTDAASIPSGPGITWKPGAKPAPAFRLADENGRPVSLAQFRGRPVVLAFMDPVCRDTCPIEAGVVNAALARVPASLHPAVVVVSVNVHANRPRTLRATRRHWHLTAAWHWAVGKPAALQRVWAQYAIAVQPQKDGELVHTEAIFVIDRHGDQRALFVWPFRSPGLAQALERLG